MFACSEFGRGAIAPLVTLGASLATLLLWPLLGMKLNIKNAEKSIMFCMIAGAIAIFLSAFTSIKFAGPGVSGFLTSATIFSFVALQSKATLYRESLQNIPTSESTLRLQNRHA